VQAGAKQAHALTPTEKVALCQAVAIGNIPAHGLKQVLQLARLCGEVKDVTDPVPNQIAAFAKLQQDGCRGNTVLVHFKSGKEAFEAVGKLHRQVVGVGKKGRKELWARQVNGEGASVRPRFPRHVSCACHDFTPSTSVCPDCLLGMRANT
jgi:hypothetical protein